MPIYQGKNKQIVVYPHDRVYLSNKKKKKKKLLINATIA